MIDIDTQFLREEVIKELAVTEGLYNPYDRDTNVRIVEDIRKAIDNLADGTMPSATHIAEIAVATNENVQIRDFLMGLRLEKDIDYIGLYLQTLGNTIKKDMALPIATVFASYLYQYEESQHAKDMINEVLQINPDYSLAKLLKEAFDKQFPCNFLTDMAEAVHEKVIDGIYELDDKEINNDSNN